MTFSAKLFYLADKLQLFSKLGTLIPPIALVLLWLPGSYATYAAWFNMNGRIFYVNNVKSACQGWFQTLYQWNQNFYASPLKQLIYIYINKKKYHQVGHTKIFQLLHICCSIFFVIFILKINIIFDFFILFNNCTIRQHFVQDLKTLMWF